MDEELKPGTSRGEPIESEGTGEPMEGVEVKEGETATIESEGKRGKVLVAIDVRVVIRGAPDGSDDGSYVPTNPEAAEWTEEAFRARGYQYVNATAEKV